MPTITPDDPNDPRFGEQFGWGHSEAERYPEGGVYFSEDSQDLNAWGVAERHWGAETRAGLVRARRSNKEDPDDPDHYPVFHHDLGGGYRAEFPIDGIYATIYHGDNALESVDFTDAGYIQGPDNQEEDKKRAMEDRRNPASVVQQIESVHNDTILPNEENYRGGF